MVIRLRISSKTTSQADLQGAVLQALEASASPAASSLARTMRKPVTNRSKLRVSECVLWAGLRCTPSDAMLLFNVNKLKLPIPSKNFYYKEHLTLVKLANLLVDLSEMGI